MEMIEEKIQLIAKEMSEASASTWTITKIIKELSEMDTKNESKLREQALKLLKKMDINAAKIYETFSKMKVYTSKETIENFNRGQIIQTLLKETTISRSVAERITLEVENEIKDSKIEFLTAALIRELVNAKLILYGFEKIRSEYTRIGMPSHEIKKRINNQAYFGEELREYNFTNVLPKDALKLHYQGTIYIEDVQGFSNRPFAYSFLSKKYENLDKTIIENTKTLLKYKNNFSIMPSIRGISFVTANFMKKESDSKKIANQINNYFSLIDNNFINYLELFVPSYLEEYAKNRLDAAKISNNLSKNKNIIFGVDSKYGLKLLNLENLSFKILNNTKEELVPFNKYLFSKTNGINLFVNINLENLSKDEDKIFDELEEVSKVIEKLKNQKKELLLQKSYLKEFEIEKMQTGIGLTNLFSVGKDINGKEKEFASKAMKEINRIFKDDLIFGLGSINAKNKFSGTIGKEVYSHSTLDFKECMDLKKICYISKARNIKEAQELIEKDVKIINFNSK